MPRWLITARQAFQRKPAPTEPPKFSVRCACGKTAEGERKHKAQQIACSTCRQPLFVLPISVYPAVRPLKKKKSAPREATEKKAATAAETAVKDQVPRGPRGVILGVDWGTWFGEAKDQSHVFLRYFFSRKMWTPVRLVFLSVVAVILGTTYLILHARAIDRATQVLASATKKGQAALLEEDFPEAARQFQLAAGALDTLKRNDESARSIRQMYRESNAASQLSPRGPYEILSDAIETTGAAKGLNWPEVFRVNYHDNWLIFEAPVLRLNEAPEPPRYLVDLPIISGKIRATIVANLPIFNQLNIDKKSQRVVFAAQIEDFRPDPDAPQDWQIVLRPGSAFLWSDVNNYKTLGFVPDDQTEQTLAAQTRLLGVEK